MELTRKLIQSVYIRVCGESGFQLDWVQAAQIASGVLKIHPLQLWNAFACIDQMQEIAFGNHPVCKETQLDK